MDLDDREVELLLAALIGMMVGIALPVLFFLLIGI
jgi:hypothetical protein